MIFIINNFTREESIMLGLLKKLFGSKPAEATQEAPYKVESKPVEDLADIAIAQRPAPVAEAPVVEAATQAMVESVAPAKKPRAKKPAAAKKPRKAKSAKS